MQDPRSIVVPWRAARAVTLLEVLVALVIAVAGLSVAIGSIAQSQRASAVTERAARELALARTIIAEAFLGVLPEELIAESRGASTVWRGAGPDGLAWEAEILVTLNAGFNARAAQRDEGLGQVGGFGAGQMPVEMITVRVGGVELRTTRW